MSYYDNEELLKYFSKEIKAQAEKDIKKLEKEIADTKARQLKQIEDELHNTIFKALNVRIDELVSEHNASINKLKTENHKSIIQKRTELLDSVILDVKTKCKKYVSSKGYVTKMKKKVADMKNVFKNSDVEFKISENDAQIKDIIKDVFGAKCKITTDEDIQIGGFVALSEKEKIMIDETIDTRINEKQKWFYEHADLAVNI